MSHYKRFRLTLPRDWNTVSDYVNSDIKKIRYKTKTINRNIINVKNINQSKSIREFSVIEIVGTEQVTPQSPIILTGKTFTGCEVGVKGSGCSNANFLSWYEDNYSAAEEELIKQKPFFQFGITQQVISAGHTGSVAVSGVSDVWVSREGYKSSDAFNYVSAGDNEGLIYYMNAWGATAGASYLSRSTKCGFTVFPQWSNNYVYQRDTIPSVTLLGLKSMTTTNLDGMRCQLATIRFDKRYIAPSAVGWRTKT